MVIESQSEKTIWIPVQRRDFIEDITLPLLPRLRLYDPSQKPKGLKKLRRKLGQVADDVVHGWMKLPSKGKLTLKMANGVSRAFEFDSHQSAYLAFASRALYEDYELAETMFLEAMLVKSRCFYDIGANWGYYTLMAATQPRFKGRIYAFDISTEMNSAMSRMAKVLELKTVEVMGYGLSDHSGYVTTSENRATHLTKVISNSDEWQDQGAKAKVVRLDDIDLPPADLMKIDVEDHEYEVLEGCRRLLDQHRPVILFESRNGGDGGQVGEFLRQHGYLLYGLQQRVGTETGVDLFPINSARASSSNQFNLVAVPNGDEGRWFDI